MKLLKKFIILKIFNYRLDVHGNWFPVNSRIWLVQQLDECSLDFLWSILPSSFFVPEVAQNSLMHYVVHLFLYILVVSGR